MLFAQRKEREVRFKLALRTVLPSVLLTITLFILFFNTDELYLFLSIMIVVSFIISYINLFIIYSGFTENIIDATTQMLNFEHIKKLAMSKKGFNYIMVVQVGDLENIDEYYGKEQINRLLKESIKTLLYRLESLGFKNVPTGYYGGGNFILLLNVENSQQIDHLESYFEDNSICFVLDVEIEIKGAIAKSDFNSFDSVLEGLLFSVEKANIRHFKQESSQEEALIARIREALDTRRISLQFQLVKSSFETEKDLIEFSARLVDIEGKIIHHKETPDIIKRLGYEKKFILLVLEKVFETMTFHQKLAYYAINISAIALRNKTMLSLILQRMKEYNIGLGTIILIVDEERFYKHTQRYSEIIKAYREAGILIALNNVGGNNASLENLKHFQVDHVRYDKSFTQSIDDIYMASMFDGIDKAIRSRGIKRWITQIESEKSFELFRQRGMDYFQGWFLAKYEDADRLTNYIKEHHEIR